MMCSSKNRWHSNLQNDRSRLETIACLKLLCWPYQHNSLTLCLCFLSSCCGFSTPQVDLGCLSCNCVICTPLLDLVLQLCTIGAEDAGHISPTPSWSLENYLLANLLTVSSGFYCNGLNGQRSHAY